MVRHRTTLEKQFSHDLNFGFFEPSPPPFRPPYRNGTTAISGAAGWSPKKAVLRGQPVSRGPQVTFRDRKPLVALECDPSLIRLAKRVGEPVIGAALRALHAVWG